MDATTLEIEDIHLIMLRAIAQFRREHPRSPTQVELGALVSRTPPTVCTHLKAMEDGGLITIDRTRHRHKVVITPAGSEILTNFPTTTK